MSDFDWLETADIYIKQEKERELVSDYQPVPYGTERKTMTYNIIDHSEHHDIHRGFIDLDGKELSITITHEGIIMDLYDDVNGCDLVATFARTFDELAEWMKENN